MRRLSDIVHLTKCVYCGTGYDRAAHVHIGVNNYEVLVKCTQCRNHDVLRISRGELGQPAPGEVVSEQSGS